MNNREILLYEIEKIYAKCQKLKRLVDSSPDQELDGILIGWFEQLTINIEGNFTFMKMILTRETPDYEDNKMTMTDQEIEKYIKEKRHLLVDDIC